MKYENSCSELHNGECRLKPDHQYYAPVQLQMLCAQRGLCDVVTYTAAKLNNMCVMKLNRDNHFIFNTLLKSKTFWTLAITEEVKIRAVKAKVEQRRMRGQRGSKRISHGN